MGVAQTADEQEEQLVYAAGGGVRACCGARYLVADACVYLHGCKIEEVAAHGEEQRELLRFRWSFGAVQVQRRVRHLFPLP